MKTRIALVVALIASVVLLSVGFAAFSTNLVVKSKLTVNANSNNFNVIFSARSNTTLTTVTPVTTGDATATDATIVNSSEPSISNFQLGFTEPGESVTYTFYVRNTGKIPAYLNSVIYNNLAGKGSFKTCTAIYGTTDSKVSAICDYVKLTLKIGNYTASSSNSNITSHTLAAGAYETVVLKIEYLGSAPDIDGDFTVEFGDISLSYSTID